MITPDDFNNALDSANASGIKKFLEDTKKADALKKRKSYPERHPFKFAFIVSIISAILGAVAQWLLQQYFLR